MRLWGVALVLLVGTTVPVRAGMTVHDLNDVVRPADFHRSGGLALRNRKPFWERCLALFVVDAAGDVETVVVFPRDYPPRRERLFLMVSREDSGLHPIEELPAVLSKLNLLPAVAIPGPASR